MARYCLSLAKKLGKNPVADFNWRFQWLWLYAFVHPQTGQTKAWILPYVNTKLFNQVLADFAREFSQFGLWIDRLLPPAQETVPHPDAFLSESI
jgi:hypothetical protein